MLGLQACAAVICTCLRSESNSKCVYIAVGVILIREVKGHVQEGYELNSTVEQYSVAPLTCAHSETWT